MQILQKLTVDQVRGEVQRFWNVFTTKNGPALTEFYGPESSVFSSVSGRSEPGRLAAARRQREYFHTLSQLRATVGMTDIVLLCDGAAAVASYTFQFHATKVGSNISQKSEENITNGRATQVFSYDADGKLRIVHEHLSSVDK